VSATKLQPPQNQNAHTKPMTKQTKKQTRRVKKAFHGWDVARFHINFPNGNHISTVWGEGTYSECHDSTAMTDYLLKRTTERPVFDSSNVEIMFDCPKSLREYIEKKYNDYNGQPIGYLPLNKWLEIVNLLAKHRRAPLTTLPKENK